GATDTGFACGTPPLSPFVQTRWGAAAPRRARIRRSLLPHPYHAGLAGMFVAQFDATIVAIHEHAARRPGGRFCLGQHAEAGDDDDIPSARLVSRSSVDAHHT